MADQIIITNDNLKDVIFKAVKFDYLKRSNVNGKKVSVTVRVTWNGALANIAMEQATQHQAKLDYNNTRPISDRDVQTETEYEKRSKLYLSLDGKVKEIDAREGIVRRSKEKEHSTEEIVKNMLDKSLPDDQKTFWKNLYDAKLAETNEATKLLAKIK